MNKKIYLQIGLWLTIILINLAFMGVEDFRAGFFEFVCAGLYAFAFYLNVLFLFPKYYDSRKFKYWLYSIILMVLVLSLINLMSDFLWGNRRNHATKDHSFSNADYIRHRSVRPACRHHFLHT